MAHDLDFSRNEDDAWQYLTKFVTLKTKYHVFSLAGARLAGKGGNMRSPSPFCKIKKSALISEKMP